MSADGTIRSFLPLLVLTLSEREQTVGLVIARYTLPWFVLALHWGPALDHFDPTSVLRLSSVGKIIGLGLFAFVALESTPTALLYILAVCYGTCEVIGESAGQVVLPAVVGRNELAQKNTTLIAVQTLCSDSLGPLLGRR